MTETFTDLAHALSRIEVAAARAEKLSARAETARQHTQSIMTAEAPEIIRTLDLMSAGQVRENLVLVARALYVDPHVAGIALSRLLPKNVTGHGMGSEDCVSFSIDTDVDRVQNLDQHIETYEALMRLADEIYTAMVHADLAGSVQIHGHEHFGLFFNHVWGVQINCHGWNIFGRQIGTDLNHALRVMREALNPAETKESS